MIKEESRQARLQLNTSFSIEKHLVSFAKHLHAPFTTMMKILQ
ncbi:hypothetical protein GJA_173 [Janthinobacterium agaricidamnosum NBRC 102515 = DSM 9628]|uniref:Uncharacterized protein n=1 Tax=Janthinobacterium agaricidamnosum NBRC 102515 = DSM 9628 TaxID=1349767 RepID=W0UYW8_9BURK|nr:hypothetical protein GJA_173 [Janthinobacterium agaricidamnosum NBRC 102515 = DSM 9628]